MKEGKTVIAKDSISVYSLRRMLSFYENNDIVELISDNSGACTVSDVKVVSKDKGWNRGVLWAKVPHKSEG